MIRHFAFVLLPVVSALIFAGGPLTGQEALGGRVPLARPSRVPVTVALVEQLPHGTGPFEIIRHGGASQHDVILLSRRAANEVELSEAIRTLLAVRRNGGDLPTRDANLRVRPRNVSIDPYPWVARVLRDLRNVAPKPLPGFGNVAFVQIWLPRQRPEGH